MTKRRIMDSTKSSFRDEKVKIQQKLKPLESIWAPLLHLMRIFGLYHISENSDGWRNIWKFHSCIVLFFVFGMSILHLVTTFSSIVEDDNYTGNRFDCVVNLFWYAGLLGYAVSFFMASHQPANLRAFYFKWLELNQVSGMGKVQRAIRRKAILITAILCVAITTCCAEIAAYRITIGWSIFLIPPLLILQSIEFLALGFYVLVLTTLTSITSHFNSQFLEFLRNPTKDCQATFEKCRSTHVLVIELIDIADNVLSFPIGYAIICALSTLTFHSFTYVLYSDDEQSSLFSSLDCVFWIIVVVIILFLILWKASAVNYEVHSILPHVNKLRIGGFSLPMQNEVIFLQNCLGNPTIGISAFKTHLITRCFSSSIASAYLSYLIILLQFKDSKCNGKDF